MTRRLALLAAIALLMAACSGGDGTAISQSATTPTSSRGDLQPTALAPLFVTEVPGAVAVNLATNRSLPPTIAWVASDGVFTASLDLDSGELDDEIRLNGDIDPFPHPIERPAVAVRQDGGVELAFTVFAGTSGSVYHVSGGSDPILISGAPAPETVLVHMSLAPDQTPTLAWLENSTLSVATQRGAVAEEVELVDDQTCDCCNPVPITIGTDLVVAYRDLEIRDGRIVRNVAAVGSADGGVTFGEPVQIADDDWFLDACPFSGPSVVDVDGELVVAWMDSRQSVHPDRASSTIWVDTSADGGKTFGVDVPVAADAIHRWPVMAVDDSGTIHMVWETQGPDGGLSYAFSSDGGSTFGDPVLLVDRELSEGPPKSPSVIFHDGALVVTWGASGKGYVAAWDVDS